jgi:hypothetical protein
MWRLPRLLLALFATPFACCPSHAQFPTRQSVEVDALVRQTANGSHYVYPSHSTFLYDTVEQTFVGGKLDYAYALNRTLAIEADAGYLFGNQPQLQQSGGKQIMAHMGVRASVPLGQSRYSFTAHMAPGIDSFSSAVLSQNFTLVMLNSSGVFTYTGTPNYGRITHFSLKEGVGVTARLTSRTALTLDVDDDMTLEGDRGQVLPGEGFTSIAENASVEDHPVVSLGLRHSFGHGFPSHEAPHEPRSTTTTELVISYALQPTLSVYQNAFETQLLRESGVALTGSHFLRPWLAFDSSLVYLGNGDQTSFQAGGPQLQFFAGVKLGVQRRRFGLYAKARPGLIAFTKAYINTAGVPPPTGSIEQFGGDIGAVLEVYPAHNLVLRFDIGETLVRYASVSPVSNYGTNYDAVLRTSQPQFLLGVGWRF